MITKHDHLTQPVPHQELGAGEERWGCRDSYGSTHCHNMELLFQWAAVSPLVKGTAFKAKSKFLLRGELVKLPEKSRENISICLISFLFMDYADLCRCWSLPHYSEIVNKKQ